jgi:hypothetical protein
MPSSSASLSLIPSDPLQPNHLFIADCTLPAADYYAPGGFAATVVDFSATLVVCPLKIRVGANSPNLWLTMFSETYIGMNFFPLCTATVKPTISGVIVERLDQVLITVRVPVVEAAFTFLRKCSSTKGPFFTDLVMLLPISHGA